MQRRGVSSSHPRRIAVFVGNYVDVVDGVAKTIRRLVQHLRARGDEVQVFAPCGPTPAFEVGPELHALPTLPLLGFGQTGYRYAFRLDAAARARLEDFDPHIVHVASPDRAATQAIEWARAHGVPVVGSFHTNFASYFRFLKGWSWLEPIAWRFITGFYGQLDEVYVPTASMLEELRDAGFGAPARLWPRGVDLERFSPRWRSAAWRREMGFADDEIVVAFVARLYWEKGVRQLAEVLERLRAAGTPHRALIVGDGPARRFLEKRLPDATFTGFISGEALSRAYASADLFFYPSETDTFGNVTLEAMASGLPVIGVDAPGTRCVVASPDTGSLVPAGDTDAMVAALQAYLQAPEHRRRSSQAARAHATRFSWPRTLERVREAYRAHLSAPPPLREAASRPSTLGPAARLAASRPDAEREPLPAP